MTKRNKETVYAILRLILKGAALMVLFLVTKKSFSQEYPCQEANLVTAEYADDLGDVTLNERIEFDNNRARVYLISVLDGPEGTDEIEFGYYAPTRRKPGTISAYSRRLDRWLDCTEIHNLEDCYPSTFNPFL